VSAREQGELQGALTSLGVAAETLGPLTGASLFGYFTRPGPHATFPGAAFILSSLLGVSALLCLRFRFADKSIGDGISLNSAETGLVTEPRLTAIEKDAFNEL
jgi:hypothetical protein